MVKVKTADRSSTTAMHGYLKRKHPEAHQPQNDETTVSFVWLLDGSQRLKVIVVALSVLFQGSTQLRLEQVMLMASVANAAVRVQLQAVYVHIDLLI